MLNLSFPLISIEFSISSSVFGFSCLLPLHPSKALNVEASCADPPTFLGRIGATITFEHIAESPGRVLFTHEKHPSEVV